MSPAFILIVVITTARFMTGTRGWPTAKSLAATARLRAEGPETMGVVVGIAVMSPGYLIAVDAIAVIDHTAEG